MDLNASQIAKLTNLNLNTINKVLTLVRVRIFKLLQEYQLRAIIKGKTSIESIIRSDGWRGYNGLVDFGYKKHFRVHHGKNEFARGNTHINWARSN